MGKPRLFCVLESRGGIWRVDVFWECSLLTSYAGAWRFCVGAVQATQESCASCPGAVLLALDRYAESAGAIRVNIDCPG